MLLFLSAILWFITITLGASLLLIGLMNLFNWVTEKIDFILQYKEQQRKEEDRRRHNCSYCYYYREGKCVTQFEQDCKDRDYFIWLPKEE